MTDQAATGRKAPEVRFYLPAVPLRPLVTSYYVVDAPGPLVDFTHPEWGNIRFCLFGDMRFGDADGQNMTPPPDAMIFGPSDRTRRFDSNGGLTIGVGLTPLGWLSLIGSDASKAANAILPLSAELGEPGPAIRDRLIAAADDAARVAILDAILTARVPRPSHYHDAAVRVQEALLSGVVDDVADLAEALGMEQRTLHRVCRSVFGFSPVRLLRRQRFLRTLARVRDALDQPLGQLIDPHYYDQAHFNRDFKAYMGMTPLAYFKSPRELMRRAAEGRRALLGAPVQGLHVSR
ncbi:AraC family transcriptional regulator [Sphingomonas bacterium]|uniref:helix-turn-helix domain-containing protein n=1 Tax=Sphingomonas bacterium TaxID=1895847 RepID=UPI002622AF68|nr:helix-turn-helix domain-containing protein [Sphingomonas bacterium]MDB5680178.1 AraC family transcriptional regulator [Sphingomonas bacterium]